VLSQVLLQAADGEILSALGRRRHSATGRLGGHGNNGGSQNGFIVSPETKRGGNMLKSLKLKKIGGHK